MTHQTFRNALNGFNREDVVHYIEFMNAQHAAEVNQLRSELEFLRGNGSNDGSSLVEQQAARIRALFDQCKEQSETITELTARLAAVPAKVEKPRPEVELDTYRRAERAERVAQERAEQIYHQANAALADATTKVDEAAALIGQMAEQISCQLSEFRIAVTGSKQALQDAAGALYAIRPEADNL